MSVTNAINARAIGYSVINGGFCYFLGSAIESDVTVSAPAGKMSVSISDIETDLSVYSKGNVRHGGSTTIVEDPDFWFILNLKYRPYIDIAPNISVWASEPKFIVGTIIEEKAIVSSTLSNKYTPNLAVSELVGMSAAPDPRIFEFSMLNYAGMSVSHVLNREVTNTDTSIVATAWFDNDTVLAPAVKIHEVSVVNPGGGVNVYLTTDIKSAVSMAVSSQGIIRNVALDIAEDIAVYLKDWSDANAYYVALKVQEVSGLYVDVYVKSWCYESSAVAEVVPPIVIRKTYKPNDIEPSATVYSDAYIKEWGYFINASSEAQIAGTIGKPTPVFIHPEAEVSGYGGLIMRIAGPSVDDTVTLNSGQCLLLVDGSVKLEHSTPSCPVYP